MGKIIKLKSSEYERAIQREKASALFRASHAIYNAIDDQWTGLLILPRESLSSIETRFSEGDDLADKIFEDGLDVLGAPPNASDELGIREFYSFEILDALNSEDSLDNVLFRVQLAVENGNLDHEGYDEQPN